MTKRSFPMLLLVIMVGLLAGCGGTSTVVPPAVDVTGEWVGTSTFEDGYVDDIRLVLNQSGATVTGVFDIWDSSQYLTIGTVSGSVSGNDVQLRLSATLGDGGSGTFAGTATDTRFMGSGTLTNGVTGDTGSFAFLVGKQ